jgi:hypothetical protein
MKISEIISESVRGLTEGMDAHRTAKHMYDRYKGMNYTAAERANDHAISYDSNTPQFEYWVQVADEIHRLEKLDRQRKDGSVTEDETLPEHIVKVKGGYELRSKHGNKNLGKYPTRAGAEKRERQVQYFKHAK